MRSMAAVVALAAFGLALQPAAAQDRMPPIPAGKLTDAQKKAIDEFKAARSADTSGPFIPLLRSPEVMSRARDGRLPAVSQRSAAAAQGARHLAHGPSVDAELRVERARPAGASGGVARRHRRRHRGRPPAGAEGRR